MLSLVLFLGFIAYGSLQELSRQRFGFCCKAMAFVGILVLITLITYIGKQ